MEFDWKVIIDYFPDLLAGVKVTLSITILSLLIGLVFGLALALARISGWKIISWPAYVYIEFFRTTPPLVQIVWFYFVVPVIIGMELSAFQAASIALGLNIAAFFGEIFRAGIESVPKGQHEASKSLGLNSIQKMRFIILPQAIRFVLPPICNQFIYIVKMSSLVSIVGLADLTRKANELVVNVYRPLEIYSFLVLEYLILILVISYFVRLLEKKLKRY